jgi:hypothetical protein
MEPKKNTQIPVIITPISDEKNKDKDKDDEEKSKVEKAKAKIKKSGKSLGKFFVKTAKHVKENVGTLATIIDDEIHDR